MQHHQPRDSFGARIEKDSVGDVKDDHGGNVAVLKVYAEMSASEDRIYDGWGISVLILHCLRIECWVYAGPEVTVVTRMMTVYGHSDVPSMSQCGPTGWVLLMGVHLLVVVQVELT